MTLPLQMLLVEAYASGGQDKRAREILEKLLLTSPNSAKVHLDLAITDAHLGDLDDAVEQYREALRLSPEDCTALMGLAKALLRLKNGSPATPYLQKYVRLRPNDAEGYFVMGCDYRDAGRFKDAAAAFAQAAHLNPEDYDIRYHLGMALLRTEEPEAALPQLEWAQRLKPEEVQVHSALARVLWSLDKETRAREESASAERLSSRQSRQNEAGLRIVNGSLLLERGDLRGAAEAFRQALRLTPKAHRRGATGPGTDSS